MATCADIDQSLANLAANNNAKFAAMQAQLDACCAKTDSLALEVAKAVQDAANAVQSVADAIAEIAKLSAIITPLLPAVTAATAAAATATLAVAGLTTAIAGVLLSIFSLDALGARIDAVENGLSMLGATVGSNYTDLRARILGISLTPGPTGATGEKGDKGDKGDKGEVGLDGATGLTGLTGERGLTGEKGDTGSKGDKGEKGEKGETGLTGFTGLDGKDGLNGLDGRTPVFGVDYFNGASGADGQNGLDGSSGIDGVTPVKNVDYFDGVNGVNGINGLDGVDKGMDCTEMTACITPFFSNLQNQISTVDIKVDNLKNSQDVFVQEQGIQWVSLIPKIITIIENLDTVFNFIITLRDLFTSNPTPLTEAEVRIIIDSFIPDFAGTMSGTDCAGTIITKQYQGKGLLGIEKLIGVSTDLTNELLSDFCTVNNPQGFINTMVCGKPFTGTFRGEVEGIQRLGDLIGFAISETCNKVDDIDDTWDLPDFWKPKLEPFMKVLLDEYFPTISGSFQSNLCDGTQSSASYLGKGFVGVQLALQSLHSAQTIQADSYFACIIQAFYPEYSGILQTTFCDGTDYAESYLERGISGLNNVLKLQNKMNVIWQNRFTECFLQSSNERKYDGEFRTEDCFNNNIGESYSNMTIQGVLEAMFRTINRKLYDLCPTFADSIAEIDCMGITQTASYQGTGYQGLQAAFLATASLNARLIRSLCEKITDGNPNDPRVNGLIRLEACNQIFQGTYDSTKVEQTNAIVHLGFKLVGDAINAVCEKFDDIQIDIDKLKDDVDPQGNVSGNLDIDACGLTLNANYTVTKEEESRAIAQSQIMLLQQVLNLICEKLDKLNKTDPANNPNVSGTIDAIICGKPYSYTYGVPESGLDGALILGTFDILSRSINELCRLIEPEQRQIYNVTGDICNEPINYPLLLTSSEFQVAQSSVSATSSLAAKICNLITEMECDPAVIEPSEKYRERIITSQMTIWFYPVGTTRSQRKTSPKWRLTISNPRPNLTCGDFAPLTWQRGKWLSKVLFDMGAIETYSYFADFNPDANNGDAINKMLYLASLSTIPINPDKPLPRVTRSNSVSTNLPNQAIMEVVRVIFVDYDANGQKTNVKCLQCVP